MNYRISRFESITELQELVDKKITELNKKIDVQSKLIGDKIREGERNNVEELSDLKDKLDPDKSKNKKNEEKSSKNKKNSSRKTQTSNSKKKSKKGQSRDWIDYENLHLYNGIGTRGELELYFKSLEEMKEESERLTNTKASLENLIKSGIKKELSGVGFEQQNGPYELAFIKTGGKREKFVFKSILTVGCE